MNDARFTRWLKQMEGARTDSVLPEADAIWWRAQLRQRLAMEERVTRPLRIAEQLACTVCLLAAVVLSALLKWGKL
ncbi:MAG: hypothetical protein LAQ69_24135 [Acidobacteriia bacterium]|nr:hypothetical protein [Terriglobia bacterium]